MSRALWKALDKVAWFIAGYPDLDLVLLFLGLWATSTFSIAGFIIFLSSVLGG